MIIPTDKMDENFEVDEIVSRHVRVDRFCLFGMKYNDEHTMTYHNQEYKNAITDEREILYF